MSKPDNQPHTPTPITIEAIGVYYREEAILIERLTEMLRSMGLEPGNMLFTGHSLRVDYPTPARQATYAYNLEEWSMLVKYPDSTDWSVLGYAENAADDADDGPVLISVYDGACLEELRPSYYRHHDHSLSVDDALIAQFDVSQWTL